MCLADARVSACVTIACHREIKPWLPSYPQELQKAIEQGASAEEKLKYPLPAKFNVGTSVVFQDQDCGQFVQ